MIELFNEDFKDTLKRIKQVDLILTDPPYPDYFTDEYKYYDGILEFLKEFQCKQLIFWSARAEFPLNYTARHIWNKNPSNAGAQYEFIYERNCKQHYKVYTYYMVNSTVAASMTNDTYEGHTSQKPIKLIRKLIQEYSAEGDTIFDPFSGSGTTAIACIEEKRNFIGCEINQDYYEKSMLRIKNKLAQPKLF